MRRDEIQEVNERVKQESVFIERLRQEIAKVIVGQNYIIERLLIGLLADGHILLEGVPGLAKTMSVSTLAQAISAKFQRIQFTPDLLPADLIGTQIYNLKDAAFKVKKGPIFANIILADEINRAPAKVQSALLEAMQEQQVTIGEETFKLNDPFLVLATQNPIEQEGTYPLPEAQVDRFMLKLNITYPNRKEEQQILKRMAEVGKKIKVEPVVKPEEILKARGVINQVYLDEKLEGYIVDIVMATREPEVFKIDVKDYIEYGASPRATIYLALAAKAYAFLHGRGYVIPQDIKKIGHDVLRHRIIVTYEAEADEITSENIIDKIFDTIEVP
ncbi:MAG TPA: AAA family ATPase [Candidatus Omnitrophica bacterium]|nr:AAA family ATPase [Candidatus Omnitrophota bacterium]